jgi:hypothetical protein
MYHFGAEAGRSTSILKKKHSKIVKERVSLQGHLGCEYFTKN